MSNIFIGLFLLSILGLIVGLIKPETVKLKSRGKVALVFGAAMIISLILFGATDPNNQEQSTSVVPVTSNSTPVATATAPVTPTPVVTKKPVVVQTQPVSQPVQTPVVVPTPAPTPAPVPVAAQPVVLLDISGSGAKSTQTFITPSDEWQLNYTYDCSSFGTRGNFQVFIYDSSGAMSFDNAGVNELGMSGADTEYYHTGGTYYLEVNSECSWHVQVKG